MTSPSPAAIPVRIHYTCYRGAHEAEEKPLVENSVQHLLANSGFKTIESNDDNAAAWVVVDGGLANTKADIEILKEYVDAMVTLTKGKSPFDRIPFPLIISTNVSRWQHSGFRFPHEFLLPLSHIVQLGDRLQALHALHGKQVSKPFNLAEFRDFVVGNFREQLGLDHSHHGTTSNLQNAVVDLKQLAQRIVDNNNHQLIQEERQVLFRWGLEPKQTDQTDVTNPLTQVFEKAAGADSIYRKLFPTSAEKLLSLTGMQGMTAQVMLLLDSDLEKRATAARQILDINLPAMHHSFPRWRGHGLTSLPVSRLTGLVVDDQAKELLDRLNQTPIESERQNLKMEKLVHFHSVFDTDKKVGNYMQEMRRFLRDGDADATGICPRCIDFVLLDLSFTAEEEASGKKSGGGSWEDPLGWRLLPVLRKWFPDIPIIIHSWFASSTQVRLAYERGAEWFLPKDDDHKLPSHIYQLLEHPHWEREWLAHDKEVQFDLPAERPSLDIEKYLWWSCIKDLPGDHIRIRPLGGGISGAVTAKAWKRINGRYDRLPPIIIKIDHPFAMGMEYERYRRFVAPYLSNRAGRIQEKPARADREHSAIAYTCAGGSQGMSGHGDRTEIIPLLKLLEMNLPKESREVLPAERYEGLFRRLLEDTLPRIHNIEQDPAHDEDFPNLVFGEFENPLNSYIARFPSYESVVLSNPLLPASHKAVNRILLTKPDAKSGILEAIRLPDQAKGMIERLTLTGPLAAHYARYRELRRNQIVKLGDEQSATRESNPKFWGTLNIHESHIELLNSMLPEFQPNSRLVGNKRSTKNSPKGNGSQWEPLQKRLSDAVKYLRGAGAKHFYNLRRGIIHGDMNLNNLMVERRLGVPPLPIADEAWMIDFAWTRRDAIASDFTQLEMDLLIRLGKPHLFMDSNHKASPSLVADFRNAYLETPWKRPHSVSDDPRRDFLFHLMKQVRDAADAAQIDSTAYAHVRLAALLITAKLRLKALTSKCPESDAFASVLCLSWLFKQHDLLES